MSKGRSELWAFMNLANFAFLSYLQLHNAQFISVEWVVREIMYILIISCIMFRYNIYKTIFPICKLFYVVYVLLRYKSVSAVSYFLVFSSQYELEKRYRQWIHVNLHPIFSISYSISCMNEVINPPRVKWKNNFTRVKNILHSVNIHCFFILAFSTITKFNF